MVLLIKKKLKKVILRKMKVEKKMKKLITIFGIAVLIFAGCSSPVETSLDPINLQQNNLTKESTEIIIVDPVVLPTELFTSKEISGKSGGYITLTGKYRNAYGDTISVDVKLSIPKGAFIGTKNISIRTDKINPCLEFQPSSVFSKPLKLNLTFKGLSTDRYNLISGETVFAHVADNGIVEPVMDEGLTVDKTMKETSVKGANIMHFSRYSFIRKSPKQS
jgi:hypothetical protein